MFAVVVIGAKQYKVQPGTVIEVDRMLGKVGETLTLDRVLLTSEDAKTSVGKPSVRGIKVTAKILAQERGEKVEVRRFKAKVRHRRSKGFRPRYTKLEIVSIGHE